MVEAVALSTAWQVKFRAGANEGLADTRKGGIGGSAGMRPHELEREQAATRFRYELVLDPALEPHRPAVMERIGSSPVRATLSSQLIFEAV